MDVFSFMFYVGLNIYKIIIRYIFCWSGNCYATPTLHCIVYETNHLSPIFQKARQYFLKSTIYMIYINNRGLFLCHAPIGMRLFYLLPVMNFKLNSGSLWAGRVKL